MLCRRAALAVGAIGLFQTPALGQGCACLTLSGDTITYSFSVKPVWGSNPGRFAVYTIPQFIPPTYCDGGLNWTVNAQGEVVAYIDVVSCVPKIQSVGTCNRPPSGGFYDIYMLFRVHPQLLCTSPLDPKKYRGPQSRPWVGGVRGRGGGQHGVVVSLVHDGPDGSEFAWSRADTPGFLSDGVGPTGATFSGTSSTSLTISNYSGADTATYVMWERQPDETWLEVEGTRLQAESELPEILSMPEPREACVGGSTEFFVWAPDALSYAWSWRGETLTDGPLDVLPEVTVSGSSTDTLVLSGLVEDAVGWIDCEIQGVGGTTQIYTANLAVSDNTLPPMITQQPTSETTTWGSMVEFEVAADAASPDGIVSYQWRKDGLPLLDSGRILGSHWPTLEIHDVSAHDAGVYDCVVTQACGTATTIGVTLTVTGCTFADCDRNGALNIDDIDCFVLGFIGGDLGLADCDASGTLNIDDIDCFVASFLSGCP